MTATIAQLAVEVKANSSQAESGLTKVGKLFSGIPGVASLAALGTVAGVVGIGVAVTKMAGDFQAGMTSLVTGAGESASNINLVSQGILGLAVDTGTSTQQLTDGMYMIESAGFHGKAGLDVLKAAAEGAKVGNADLGTVADATTTILKDYPGVMGGATGAVNELVATVANGKTHMQDLSGALSQILPTASAAHVGLNDVMGAMATMTGEGVPAANAATYLRQTILALDAPSSAAKKALASVGLSSADVAKEMQKSLPDALKMITDAVGKKFPVGSAAYVDALKNISGGSKQMQGVLDLTGNHMKDFTGNVEGISGAVKKGGKSITGWSDVQGDFNFKMDKAREVVETLGIRIGGKLLPVIGSLVSTFTSDLPGAIDFVTGAINGVVGVGQGLIKFFQDTGPASTAVKIVLGILTGALLGFAASAIPAAVTAIMASVTAFGAQAVAAGAAAIATLAAAAPFIIIGAAIGAVIGIVILAVTHWKQITEALGHFKDILGNVAGAIGGFVGGVMGALGKFFGNFLGAIGGFFGNVIGAVTGFIGKVLGFYVGLFGGILGAVGTFAGNFLGAIGGFFGNVFSAVGGFVGTVIGFYVGLWVKIVTGVLDFAGKFLGAIGTFAGNVLGAVGSFVGKVLGFYINLWGQITGTLHNMIGNFLGMVGGWKDQFLGMIGGMVGSVLGILGRIKDFLTGELSAAWNGLGSIVSGVWSGIKGAVSAGINGVIDIINGLISAIDGISIDIPKVGPFGGGHVGFSIPQIPHLASGGDVSGMFVGGEDGAELLTKPGLYKAPAGSHVYSASDTSRILGNGGGGASGGGVYIAPGTSLSIPVYIAGRNVAQVLLPDLAQAIRTGTGIRSH